jgi:hypothetical protein
MREIGRQTMLHIYSWSIILQAIYAIHDMAPEVNPLPDIGNWLNISKTVEIPTLKPYMFLWQGTSDGM